MSLAILCLIFFCQVSSSVSQNDTQCIENPTGEVSLNVPVRGVPGPEGPQGHKGDIGPRGLKGEKGIKGQKGAQGTQGIPGPHGSPGLVGSQGNRGSPGHEGPQGPIGPPGQPGQTGPRGPQGRLGDTVLTEKEFNLVKNNVRNSVHNDLNSTVTNKFDDVCKKVEKLNNSLQAMHSRDQELLNIVMAELRVMNETLNSIIYVTKCGIWGNWSRIAYFDTTQGDSCPVGLRTVTNTTTSQTACGKSISGVGCTSLNFLSGERYSKECGRVRGYQFGSPDAFQPSPSNIDSYYVDGISITSGNPRYHLWTYAAGASETVHTLYRCPCAREGYIHDDVPAFVGDHYYCESGFGTRWTKRMVWEDHLWDGNRCLTANNRCCDRFGWFSREVDPSSNFIEV